MDFILIQIFLAFYRVTQCWTGNHKTFFLINVSQASKTDVFPICQKAKLEVFRVFHRQIVDANLD